MNFQDWFKIKGYYHISPQNGGSWNDFKRVENRIKSKSFVSKYAFYPLLHTEINERRYKRNPYLNNKRSHSYLEPNGSIKKNVKKRPLHYANHFDALIFSYYAYQLQKLYDNELAKNSELNNSITAYRKIPVEDAKNKNKGNIHFAKEVFEEIKTRTKSQPEVIVLAFDIKSFFSSLNHTFLYNKWAALIGCKKLPQDHLNVFKAATNFSFIFKNDLKGLGNGKNNKFDERRLASIRNNRGFKAYFESPKDFRTHVKDGKIRIYQNAFKNDKGQKIGIPQGLPISAILANLYLIDFDKTIVSELVLKSNCFYRRYSDDIIIICKPEQMDFVNDFVINEMKNQEVSISEDKTEIYKFFNDGQLTNVFKKNNENWEIGKPLNYLGFEFYGYKTLIKSSNLSKFYRRMIYSVKSKAKLAFRIAEQNNSKPIIFKRPLYRIYRNVNLDSFTTKKKFTSFKKLDTGDFRLISMKKIQKPSGSYFSYARRAAEIMNEPAIISQLKNEKKVFNQALDKHFYSQNEFKNRM